MPVDGIIGQVEPEVVVEQSQRVAPKVQLIIICYSRDERQQQPLQSNSQWPTMTHITYIERHSHPMALLSPVRQGKQRHQGLDWSGRGKRGADRTPFHSIPFAAAAAAALHNGFPILNAAASRVESSQFGIHATGANLCDW